MQLKNRFLTHLRWWNRPSRCGVAVCAGVGNNRFVVVREEFVAGVHFLPWRLYNVERGENADTISGSCTRQAVRHVVIRDPQHPEIPNFNYMSHEQDWVATQFASPARSAINRMDQCRP